jgi:Pyocin activator protein PrtN
VERVTRSSLWKSKQWPFPETSKPPRQFSHQRQPRQSATNIRTNPIEMVAIRVKPLTSQRYTAFLLMALDGGKAIIPIEDVCWDYFSHLNPNKLMQKIGAGKLQSRESVLKRVKSAPKVFIFWI